MHSFYCIHREYITENGEIKRILPFRENNTETLCHIFFQCLKIKPIIEELNTMIIALCDQNYVLNEEDIKILCWVYISMINTT